MKNCPVCNAVLEDSTSFCTQCGAPQPAAEPAGNPNPQVPPVAPPPNYGQTYAPAYDPYDHTADYDPKDISDNKVIAMAPYLLSTIGVIIALLAAKESPYVAFHVRQALKFQVVTILLGIVAAVLAITIIVPIAAGICILILVVLQIIAFFQVCGGKAKEPAIIRSLGFLK